MVRYFLLAIVIILLKSLLSVPALWAAELGNLPPRDDCQVLLLRMGGVPTNARIVTKSTRTGLNVRYQIGALDSEWRFCRMNRGPEEVIREAFVDPELISPERLLGKRLLDVASGEQGSLVVALRAQGIAAIGLDLLPDSRLETKGVLYRADMADTRQPDGAFEVITSFWGPFSYQREGPEPLNPVDRQVRIMGLMEFERIAARNVRIILSPVSPANLELIREVIDQGASLHFRSEPALVPNGYYFVQLGH